MGYCQVAGNTQSCTPEDCTEFMGHYFEKASDFPGGCFLLSVLDDERAMLMAGTMMYPTLIQFRDDILRRAPLGRQLIAYFDEFYEEAKAIARKDPQLITEVVWLVSYVTPLLQSMLGQKPAADSTIETPLSRLASEYRPATHKAFVSVVNRFKAKSGKKFTAALNDSEKIVSRFVGLGPMEALSEIRRPLPETKRSSKK